MSFEKFVGLMIVAVWLERRFKFWSDLGTIFIGIAAMVAEGLQFPEADDRRH